MTAITEADSHQTGDKDILPEHKLSQESKRLLEEYFKPFNLLLEEFLGESVGFWGCYFVGIIDTSPLQRVRQVYIIVQRYKYSLFSTCL